MHELAASDAVFVREDANTWRASELARGPWDPRADVWVILARRNDTPSANSG